MGGEGESVGVCCCLRVVVGTDDWHCGWHLKPGPGTWDLDLEHWSIGPGRQRVALTWCAQRHDWVVLVMSRCTGCEDKLRAGLPLKQSLPLPSAFHPEYSAPLACRVASACRGHEHEQVSDLDHWMLMTRGS